MHSGAKWIWKNGENRENTWLNFVKRFDVDTLPETARVRIAVDSKYWLYINGEMIVFEGGLKRGPSKHGTYYDEIDIAAHLQRGANTVAILVQYFGKSGFSHLSSGMGGLLFEADINGDILLSDGTWRVMKNPAYVKPDALDIPPNFRLSEPNIYFDAAKDVEGWYLPDRDISGWDYADVVGCAGEGVWGELKCRDIPMFRNSGLRDYINSSDFIGFTAEKELEIDLRLPYNAQVTPYLKVKALKGKRISIRTDNKFTNQSVMAVYYTRDGEQEYESLGWMNGEHIFYTIPAGVTVLALKYRETGYDTSFTGSFESSDAFLNELWKKSLRTLYITMRDNFMDCPDRERAQWWGDVNIEMQMLLYCMDERALLLYKKGVETMARWSEDNGCMLTVVPTGTEEFELPMQNLAGIWGFWYYYEYTGDISVPRLTYEMSKRYVLSFSMGDNGLVEHKTGSWDWPDWGDNADIAVMENAWFYMALGALKKMAALLEHDRDIQLYEERQRTIRENFDRAFRKENHYYGHTANGIPDDRANALAALSGLAGRDMYDGIARILTSVENASPYMEKYVLDALCEMGYTEDAAERMKRRYRQMVEYDYSTLWEYWGFEGTLNHAWSGGPLITMSKYLAGIRPLNIAYERFEMRPRLCGLSFISCEVPSARGHIRLVIEKGERQIDMSVQIPRGTVADVYLPLFGGMTPENTQYSFTTDGEYAHFVLTEGIYSLSGREGETV